jgi:hypothetical protein
MQDGVCKDAAIALGCVGLTAIIDDSFNNADSLSRALDGKEAGQLVRMEKRV